MLRFIKLNPAAITGAVAALVNFGIAFGVHISHDQAAAIGVITGAALTIIAAASTRPVGLQVILGSVTTIVGGMSAFHFHLSASQVSTGATVLSLALATAFHLAHVPVKAWKLGTDATALERRAAAAR